MKGGGGNKKVNTKKRNKGGRWTPGPEHPTLIKAVQTQANTKAKRTFGGKGSGEEWCGTTGHNAKRLRTKNHEAGEKKEKN